MVLGDGQGSFFIAPLTYSYLNHLTEPRNKLALFLPFTVQDWEWDYGTHLWSYCLLMLSLLFA